ncbi:hypothetical protein [Ideonella azotifigens]|uniref:Uncharacterized protein n=1 Tax=Ideonella azotifigens TaxID=513160 RepID=A0ABN1K406_9BURK|nr:hypothetical protein [Ideonella azotifigens]
MLTAVTAAGELKVRSWEALERSAAIEKLEVRYIGYLPTDYFVLVEGSIIIAGTYAPSSDNGASPVDVYSPVILHDQDAGPAKIVSQFQTRFDALWKGAHVRALVTAQPTP